MRPTSRLVACLIAGIAGSPLLLGCGSGPGGGGTGGTSSGGTTGAAGTGSPGTAGTTGSGGTTGTAGTQGTAGSGGNASGTAGSAAGASGSTGSGGAGGDGAGGSGRGGGGGAGGSAGSSGGGAGGRGGGGGATAGTGGATGGARGGAGGSAGAGGSSVGGAGGGTSNPVTPTKNGSRFRFTFGDVVFEIDAMVGGRVGLLTLGGANLIMPSATDPTTWGSVFWTSPRSAWTPMLWPPPPMIDNAAYTGDISGTHVVLNGPTDTSIGVSMSKDYAADAGTGWINITYTINATKAMKAAPWEVTRVPRGGIVFFPATSVTKGPLTITQSNGIVWFDDAPKTATSPDGAKLYGDGMGGWEAYVLDRNLFLKKFADTPASAQPAEEGEIDVYPGAGFLEFEVQGPYTQVAANGKIPWSMQWKVVKVPTSVSVAVGSTALVDFAKQQLGL